MTFFLIGVAVAIIVYLYLVSSLPESGTQENRQKEQKQSHKKEKSPEQAARKDSKPKPHIRYCPLCGSPMEKGEKLYVEVYKAEPRDKVFIRGCRACAPPAYFPEAVEQKPAPAKPATAENSEAPGPSEQSRPPSTDNMKAEVRE